MQRERRTTHQKRLKCFSCSCSKPAPPISVSLALCFTSMWVSQSKRKAAQLNLWHRNNTYLYGFISEKPFSNQNAPLPASTIQHQPPLAPPALRINHSTRCLQQRQKDRHRHSRQKTSLLSPSLSLDSDSDLDSASITSDHIIPRAPCT